jgi:hypothetical protein
MMKKQWGLIFSVLLAFCLLFIGCDHGNGNEDGIDKKLTITGISGISSTALVVMLNTVSNGSGTWAAGGGWYTSETVTIQLRNATSDGGYGEANWTGTGEYYIALWKSSDGNFSGYPDYYTPQKVNFQTETTTVEWSKFSPYP